MNSKSINLWAEDELAFVRAVKRKWRQRLERRGIRLALAPAGE